MKAMTSFIPCVWNPAKCWVVTRTNQGKYYLNQMINGQMMYEKAVQMKKRHICQSVSQTVSELNVAFS